MSLPYVRSSDEQQINNLTFYLNMFKYVQPLKTIK